MRHRKSGVKLGRTDSHRKAMFRNMLTSLFKHDKIRTTHPKAMELRRLADHMVTLAKRGDLHARRQALSIIREKNVVHQLFAEAQDRYGSVAGGYTRVIKLGRRPGDAALMSMIELVRPDGAKPASQSAAPAAAQAPVAEKAAAEETQEVKEDAAAPEEAAAEDKTEE